MKKCFEAFKSEKSYWATKLKTELVEYVVLPVGKIVEVNTERLYTHNVMECSNINFEEIEIHEEP